MARPNRKHLDDVRGATRLVVEAATGVTDAVEAMHRTIQRRPGPLADYEAGRTRGITGLVYRAVRGGLDVTGRGLDAALGALTALAPEGESSPPRDALLAAINGVYGDYLVATGNELALDMQLRAQDGRPIEAATPAANVVVLAHGLCMGDTQWERNGHHHGRGLAAQLGVTPLYLRYNSGLPVADNGRAFAEQLEGALRAWPVEIERLALLGFSMGGLVSRSAWYYARESGMDWPTRLDRYVSLGTPHLGATLAKGGHLVDQLAQMSPYAVPLGRLAQRRSAGLHDLRHGAIVDDPDQLVGLPEGVQCFAAAGRLRAEMPGDGLVPVASALGRSRHPERSLSFPDAQTYVAEATSHLDLLGHGGVFERLCEWLA